MALANDGGTLIGGVDRVRFHFEGESIDVVQPSFREFTRYGGSTYQQLGYWAELTKPKGIEGEALLYIEAISADATMQSRVIGPFTYFLYDDEFTHDLTLDPLQPLVTGSNYHDLRAALNYLRSQDAQRSRIVGSGSTHTLPTSTPFRYSDGQTTVIEWSEPVTISRDEATKGDFRPNHSGMIFRGENITFDMRYISRFVSASGGEPYQFDRVRFINSGGRSALWDKGRRRVAHTFQEAEGGGVWLADCAFEGTRESGQQVASLVRGCTFDDVGGDNVTNALCVLNCITRGLDDSELRSYLPALTVQGPATATLSLDGINDDAQGRTFTAKVGGSTVGTFAVSSDSADVGGGKYDVADVVDWLNTLSGWTATLLDDTRRATAIELNDGNGGFTDLDVSSQQTLTTHFDIHNDWMQSANRENGLVMNNVGTDMRAQLMLFTKGTTHDFAVVNNAFTVPLDSVLTTQFGQDTSHLLLVHNTCPDQGWIFRAGWADGAYCLLKNNILESAGYSDSTPAAEVIEDNHYLAGANTFGEASATIGGTRDDLFADVDAGDFAPAGELLTNLKTPVFDYGQSSGPRPAGRIAI